MARQSGDNRRVAGPPYTKLPGDMVQRVNTQTGAVATGTTLLPNDDTIPQNTEGTEFMTLAVWYKEGQQPYDYHPIAWPLCDPVHEAANTDHVCGVAEGGTDDGTC